MNSQVVQSSSDTAEYNNSVFQESKKLYVSSGKHISISNVAIYQILELAPKSGIFLKSNGIHILNKDRCNAKIISDKSLDQCDYDKSLCFNLLHTDNNVEVSGDISASYES